MHLCKCVYLQLSSFPFIFQHLYNKVHLSCTSARAIGRFVLARSRSLLINKGNYLHTHIHTYTSHTHITHIHIPFYVHILFLQLSLISVCPLFSTREIFILLYFMLICQKYISSVFLPMKLPSLHLNFQCLPSAPLKLCFSQPLDYFNHF